MRSHQTGKQTLSDSLPGNKKISNQETRSKTKNNKSFLGVMMKCRYSDGKCSCASMLYFIFMTELPLSRKACTIYTQPWNIVTAKQIVSISRTWLLQRMHRFCLPETSAPPFWSSLAAALTASWNNDSEECYWAQQAHGNSGTFSYGERVVTSSYSALN